MAHSPSERAEALIEALPFIQKFRGALFVIKYGGSAMDDETVVTMLDYLQNEANGAVQNLAISKDDLKAVEDKKKEEEKKKKEEDKKKEDEKKKEEEKIKGEVNNIDFSLIFPKKCAKCHGKDGTGKIEGVPNLTASETKSKSLNQLIQTITNGKQGKTEDDEDMPSFKNKLTEEEIQAAAKYVKGL
jgi:hypothetical protein